MDAIFSLVLLISALILYRFLSSGHQRRSIPGPKGYPLVGAALHVKPNLMHFQFSDYARQFGQMFKIQMFGTQMLVLNSVDMITKAFSRNDQVLSNRTNIFVMDHIKVRQSISFRDADKVHTYSRKSFVKGIHAYGIGIPKFEGIVKGEIKRVLKQIEDLDGQEFEVNTLINRSLINVMSILLIGEDATEEDAEMFAEYVALQDFFLNPLVDNVLSHLPFLLLLPYLKRKMDRVFEAKRKLQETYFSKAKASKISDDVRGLTDWLLQDQQGNPEAESILTDDVIKAIVLTDVLTAEAFVMESMRYITAVPFPLPRLCTEDIELEGYKVPVNTQVVANSWFIHHDENIWGDPWTFRPERFLDENGKLLPNNHQYMKSWMPFGFGRRRCPGMAMATSRTFLYLTSILQRLTLVPSSVKCGSCDPRTDDFVFNLLVRPKPFYCIATLRK